MGQALHQEEVEGDLRAAIATYTRVVADTRASRKVVATALFRLGLCFERLGDTESRKAYERIIREFADQPDVVALARGRLARSTDASPGRVAHELVWTAPKGAWVASTIARNGRFLAVMVEGTLIVHDLETGTDRRAAMNGEREALWAVVSPQGDRAVCLSVASPGQWRLDLIDWPRGGEARLQTLLGPAGATTLTMPLDWSPDGRSIAVGVIDAESGATGQLALLSIADRTVRTLTTLRKGALDLAANRPFLGIAFPQLVNVMFSPDGRQIAFDVPVSRSLNRDIFVVDTAGPEQVGTPVVASGADETLVGWSPDGLGIVYTTAGPAGSELRIATLKDERPLANPRSIAALGDPSSEMVLGLTRDGVLYKAACTGCQRQVKIVNFDAATGRIVEPTIVLDTFVDGPSHPAWSGDGQWLAYLSRVMRVGTREAPVLSIRASATGETHEVLPNLASIRNPVLWARDASYLLAHGVGLDGVDGLYKIDPRNGAASPIYTLDKGERGYLPQWSTDGTRIYLRVDRQGQSVFLERHMGTGAIRQIFESPKSFGTVLMPPDRERATVTSSPDASDVWTSLDLVRIGDGSRTTLVTLPAGQSFIGSAFASRDGTQIAALIRDNARSVSRLVLVSSDTGQMKELMTGALPKSLPLPAIAWWLPDGQSLLFRRAGTNGASEIWQVPLNGTAPRRLALDENSIMTVAGLTHDGRQIAFEVPPANAVVEVWAVRNLFARRP